MGYARLSFPTTVTTGQMLLEVVNVFTGNTTNTSSLSYANSSLSEIVNTLNENWTILYGQRAANNGAYVLTSQCTTNTKTHHVHLFCYGTSIYDSSAQVSSSYTGICLSTISAASNSTTLSDSTFYTTSTTSTSSGRAAIRTTATDTYIVLNWSSHHILIYGMNTSGATGFRGSFEYPENSLTQFTNTPPVLNYSFSRETGGDTAYATTTGAQSGTWSGVFQGIKIHTPPNATTYGAFNILGDTDTFNQSTGGFGSVGLPRAFPPAATIDSTANNAYQLIPIFYSLPRAGIPILDISRYSGVYYTSANNGNSGDTFTVGSDSYVWFPAGTALSGGTQTFGLFFLKK